MGAGIYRRKLGPTALDQTTRPENHVNGAGGLLMTSSLDGVSSVFVQTLVDVGSNVVHCAFDTIHFVSRIESRYDRFWSEEVSFQAACSSSSASSSVLN